jgi:GntR family transcriptional repressor for pyruvate dehydrogenase complex
VGLTKTATVPTVTSDNSSRGRRGVGTKRFTPRAIQPVSAANQIAKQLRQALISGRLRPGDRLPSEEELAEEFHVSRATLREAIQILRAQGVVRTSRGAKGGHFITRAETHELAQSVGETYRLWFDAGDVSIAEVDEAREVVERACVRLAAQRRSPRAIEAMHEIIERAAEPTLSLEQYLALDVAFHGEIARAAGNRLLELPMTAIHTVRPRTNQIFRRHDREFSHRQHIALFEAIEAGDAAGAERAFNRHIEYATRERQAALAERQKRASEISVGAIEEAGPDSSRDPDEAKR